ncbi:glutathione S-transferase family protein [Xanthobacter sp. KR7-225]|uniref:glutathione S-transferase family protein n=1 Tax=Xanthobacter sp. KR7-225 TaxID=3156613 RepID=UPI0032B6274A
MKLVGMLDSPYVRRTAVSLRAQNIPFEHLPLSTFASFDAFAAINPVVKAPSFVTDEGIVLMDSSLILEYGERLAAPSLKLAPQDMETHARAQRIIGLALAACEKTVQIVYEHNLRPPEKWHQPWLDRVRSQLVAAYGLLEQEVRRADPWLFGERPLQADITSAVAFRFTREKLPQAISAEDHAALAALSARAEATEPFCAFPFV